MRVPSLSLPGMLSVLALLGKVVLFSGPALHAQEAAPPGDAPDKITVSGYVEDASSSERLPGAAVYAPDRDAGTTTNRYGFFSLTLPRGTHRLAFRYVGYQPRLDTLALRRDTMLTVALAPARLEGEAVVVEAERGERIEESTRMSTIGVPVEQIESLPALAGEVDVLKALQLLPGVKGGQEATSGLYVRGGGPSQNLILLDGVPVYNASHLFGFLSVFNSDAIQSVELTKGGFPARYGGRLSSVVEIGMKEGNQKEYAAQGSIGLLSSRLTVEGPIIEDRTSFMVSGRRTYADLVLKPLIPDEEGEPTAYFYDLNAKVNHTFSPRDRVFFSVYTGEDRFGADFDEQSRNESGRLYWGNVTAALRWNHLFSDKLFSNTTLTFSDYDFNVNLEERLDESDDLTAALRYQSGVRDWGAQIDFDYLPAPDHYVRFGAAATVHQFNPGALSQVEVDAASALDTTFSTSQTRALQMSAYAEDDVRLTSRLKVNAGLHASAFHLPERTYTSLQPRLSARYRLSDRWAMKASGATMRQYIHLLSNAGVGLPTDLWVPATERVDPQEAWQVAAGLTGTLNTLPFGLGRGDGSERFEVSLEGYYKGMDELITYEPGAVFASPLGDWQDRVVTGGRGTSYGAEFFIHKKTGRTTGWLGYTLSWTDRQFEALNGGDPFAYRYDRRHDINVVLSHRLSDRLDLSATAVYNTGSAVTLPSAEFASVREPFGRVGGGTNYYDERNGFRMPAYHRLDLGARYYFSRAPNEHVLAVSVYNAYNHKNPFFLDLTTNDAGERELTGYTIFPVLPSIAYRFSF